MQPPSRALLACAALPNQHQVGSTRKESDARASLSRVQSQGNTQPERFRASSTCSERSEMPPQQQPAPKGFRPQPPLHQVPSLASPCYHGRDYHVNTNVMQGGGQIIAVNSIATRLKQAREARGWSQEQLAVEAGVSQGTIGNIESGARKRPRDILRIASAVGVSPEWLQDGTGQQFIYTREVAHTMSLTDVTLLPILMKWEEVMKRSDLPDRFISVMPDDQAAPRCANGAQCVWSTIKPARPGRVVLLKDKHGQLHAREYRQGKAPGQWTAAAINPAYVSFESEEDGLSVVATLAGVIEGDD